MIVHRKAAQPLCLEVRSHAKLALENIHVAVLGDIRYGTTDAHRYLYVAGKVKILPGFSVSVRLRVELTLVTGLRARVRRIRTTAWQPGMLTS